MSYGDPFGSPIGFNFIFSIFPIIFIIVFAVIVVGIIYSAVKGIKENRRNNASPVLTVEAKLVTKRTEVQRRHHHHHTGHDGGMMHDSYSNNTNYFVTFEVASKDRMEFKVSGQEYGLLAEGDVGKLTFQGTRFQGLERT